MRQWSLPSLDTGCGAQCRSRATGGKMEIMTISVVSARKIKVSRSLKTSAFYVFVVDFVYCVLFHTILKSHRHQAQAILEDATKNSF